MRAAQTMKGCAALVGDISLERRTRGFTSMHNPLRLGIHALVLINLAPEVNRMECFYGEGVRLRARLQPLPRFGHFGHSERVYVRGNVLNVRIPDPHAFNPFFSFR
jgi:hypothetical protein